MNIEESIGIGEPMWLDPCQEMEILCVFLSMALVFQGVFSTLRKRVVPVGTTMGPNFRRIESKGKV